MELKQREEDEMTTSNDRDFIINSKLTNAGLSVHGITNDDDISEIYDAYENAGGLCLQSPADTHFVMDADKIIFIGNKDELLGFVNSNF